MTTTRESGKKAAETRGHESLRKAGEQGNKAAYKQPAQTRGHESLSRSEQKGGGNSHKNK